MKVSLRHALVDGLQLDEDQRRLVPHVLDLLVDEVPTRTRVRCPHHVLLENLLEFVLKRFSKINGCLLEHHESCTCLQQNFGCVLKLGLLVETVELDVRPPGEEDEEEAAGEEDQNAGEETLRRAEHETLDGLGRE